MYIESFDYGRLDYIYVRTLNTDGDIEINVDTYLLEADEYKITIFIDGHRINEKIANKY